MNVCISQAGACGSSRRKVVSSTQAFAFFLVLGPVAVLEERSSLPLEGLLVSPGSWHPVNGTGKTFVGVEPCAVIWDNCSIKTVHAKVRKPVLRVAYLLTSLSIVRQARAKLSAREKRADRITCLFLKPRNLSPNGRSQNGYGKKKNTSPYTC